MGGRSDLFNSGEVVKGEGEGIFSKFRGKLAKRGELQNQGGVWTLGLAPSKLIRYLFWVFLSQN